MDREYFGYEEMSEADFRSLQLIELDMLIYFDRFCKEHGLRYYLAGGTLIGAIRHKGFIPWDEDIDLHMPRPDYERLPELWEKYANVDSYSLCVTNEKKNYRHNVYTIANNKTTLLEERTINDDIVQGIRIDILPFDGVPGNKLKAAIQFFWAIIFNVYNVQRLPENQGGKFMKFIVYMMLTIIRDTKKRYKLWNFAKKQMIKYNFDNSPWIRELSAPLRSMMIKYPGVEFTDSSLVEFEGHKFPVHHYYLDYLNKVYPGFMEFPPLEKRKPKTRAIYINLDKSYKEYKGIYYCKKGK